MALGSLLTLLALLLAGAVVGLLVTAGYRLAHRNGHSRTAASVGAADRATPDARTGITSSSTPLTASGASLAPPDQTCWWRAEIEWRRAGDACTFALRAWAEDGARPVDLAETSRLAWPPATREAVGALSDAAEALEGAAIEAGWAPAGHGDHWYAKRFLWTPRAGGHVR